MQTYNGNNSCTFCGATIAKWEHVDAFGRALYLCDDHKAECYNEDANTITPPAAPSRFPQHIIDQMTPEQRDLLGV